MKTLILAAIAVFLTRSDIVTAKELRIVDDNGIIVGSWTTQGKSQTLRLGTLENSIRIETGPGSASILILGKDGKKRVIQVE